MCLAKVDVKRKCKISGYGYKVFEGNGNVPRAFAFFDSSFFRGKNRRINNHVPINKWLVSNPICFSDDKYVPDFHLFKRKEDAEIWGDSMLYDVSHIVLKVKYRKATCTGYEFIKSNDMTTIVAKEIFILRKKGKK